MQYIYIYIYIYDIHAYHILLVNSHGYYKFQVEIGAVASQNFILKLCVRYKLNIVLRGDYLSHGY